MPLTPLPDQGIEVPLSEYNRLRAFQGGGWFWDHDNQQVIREVLGDFLPRVEERRDRGGALFQHFVGNTEAASRSHAVGAQMNRVPRGEYQRLQRALENLKLKAQDPNTDPNARKVIEKFCLPDPSKDPDLYRLYGSGWNRRLLVLWGCEREEGTSLAPTAALSKIAVESPATGLFRRLPVLLGWLLLLIVGAWWWQQHEAAKRVADQTAAVTPPPAVANGLGTVPGDALDTRATADNAAATANANPGDLSVAPSSTPMGTLPPSADQKAGLLAAPDTARPMGNNSLGTTPQSAGVASVGGSSSAMQDHTATATRDSASTNANAHRAPASSPTLTANPGAGETLDGAETAGNERSQSSDRTATAPTATANPANGKPNSAVADSTKSAAPPKVEILKAQSSSTPHDGKMDVILMATGHESDGGMAPLEITRWSVDDQPQLDQVGRDVTAGQLNLSLSPGKHHVSVAAKAHGAAVEAETDVDVQIKSQGDVTVKPRGSK